MLRPALGLTYDVQGWTAKAERAVQDQWARLGRAPEIDHWDWSAIVAEYSGLGDWCLSVWSGDRLSALAAAKMTKMAVVLAFLEGDPSRDCPLRKQRFGIVLDMTMRYGRLCGRREIRIDPINDTLTRRYERDFGFAPHPANGKPAYHVRNLGL